MTEPAFEEIRLSTEERTQALDALSAHFVEGRLSHAEFDERSGAIMEARVVGDLASPFEGLPGGLPLVPDSDGRPVPRGSSTALEPRDQPSVDLDKLRTKGKVMDRIDGTVMSLTLVSFLLMQFVFHTPRAWLAWVVGLAVVMAARAIAGYDDSDEEAYEQLKEAEEAERAERLKLALERRRQLEK